MKYLFRDKRALSVAPPTLSLRGRVLHRIRVYADDPAATAADIPSRANVYLQGMYDDDDGVTFEDDGERMAYWTGWVNAFLLAADARPAALWIEHPYSIGGRRLRPEWMHVFETLLALMRQRLDCPCLQFGVPRVSPNVYQVPLAGLCGVEPGSIEGVWVNLPGQHAFTEGRTTTLAEFAAGIAWAKAHSVPDVCLWSNPGEDLSTEPRRKAWEQNLEAAWRVIELVDPAPRVGSIEWLEQLQWHPGDTWQTFMERRAELLRQAEGAA